MTEIKYNFKIIWEVLFFVLLGAILRLLVLIISDAGIESDEAIVGLMGLHILDGKKIPTFYYGQAYMGSLEGIISSVYFKFLGVNNWALKLVPFSFSLFHIVISYCLGFLVSNRAGARISALYVALAPCSLIIWSSKARGGFIETLFLGSLALCLSHIYLSTFSNSNLRRKTCLLSSLGFVLGLGWWTNNQIVFFMAPIGLGILIFLLTNKVKLYEIITSFILGLSSFILGGLPFWIYNLNSHPKWESFEVLFGKTAGSSSTQYFKDFWTTALPIILGASKFWTDYELYNNSTLLIYVLVGLLFSPMIIFYKNNYKKYLVFSPILLFFIFTPIIFSFSSFGWLSMAPRYLLPMYSVIPVVLSICYYLVRENKLIKTIFISLFSLLILNNLASNYLGGTISNEGQPLVFLGDRVSDDHKALYDWLENNNCTHINTNYWIGYRIAFETKEKVTFTRFGKPRTLRIPEYEKIIDNSDENNCGLTYVLVKTEVPAVVDWLESTGQSYKKEFVGEYTVISRVGQVLPEGKEIDYSSQILASRVFIPPGNKDLKDFTKDLSTLFDGSIESRWRTGRSQITGMAIELDLKTPTSIGRILFDFDKFLHDAPISLVISGYKKDGTRVNIVDMRNKFYQKSLIMGDFPHLPEVWDIRFNPVEVKTLRFELMEGVSTIFDWSIPELKLFEVSLNPNYKKKN